MCVSNIDVLGNSMEVDDDLQCHPGANNYYESRFSQGPDVGKFSRDEGLVRKKSHQE